MITEGLLREVRKYVFDYFLEETRAPVLEEIMRNFHTGRSESHSLFRQLELARHVVLVPSTQRILMANPFPSLTTPFRVRVGGRGYYAACAWDAVAFHVMLGRETMVDSSCHHCGEPIRIRFGKGRVESSSPRDPLVFISLPAVNWWDNIINTCSNNMVFFGSREHLKEWSTSNPCLNGEALTLAKTFELSVPIYKEKMRLDYSRPTKEQLVSYWDSIGLRGDFWKL